MATTPTKANAPAVTRALGATTPGNSTAKPDPLKGWLDLAGNAKPSRNRPQKRGWQRGARR